MIYKRNVNLKLKFVLEIPTNTDISTNLQIVVDIHVSIWIEYLVSRIYQKKYVFVELYYLINLTLHLRKQRVIGCNLFLFY